MMIKSECWCLFIEHLRLVSSLRPDVLRLQSTQSFLCFAVIAALSGTASSPSIAEHLRGCCFQDKTKKQRIVHCLVESARWTCQGPGLKEQPHFR